jgi:predicted MFS family arabinose efflux permease
MRNVWILALAQALSGSGMIMLVTFGGIVGARLAPTPAAATLPLSLSIVGAAVCSIPAALLMQRFGRKPLLVASALATSATGLVMAYSIAHADFTLLCIGALLLGANMAFVLQYRFAATEYVTGGLAPRAVATVMLGTLVAAFATPEIGDRARLAGGWPEFTGSFVALAVIALAGAVVLLALGPPATHAVRESGPGRPLGAIAREPAYVVAVLCGVASYSVMSFIMTATPISMHVIDGHAVRDTKNVITAHLLAMYLPSLASGWLTQQFGLIRTMGLGLACMLASVVVAAFTGHAFMHYFWALVLLGVGWNFLFVAGTTLLTTTYAPSERFRAQGFNDLATFGAQAVASLLAGVSIERLGWESLNLASVPVLLATLGAMLWWRARAARA